MEGFDMKRNVLIFKSFNIDIKIRTREFLILPSLRSLTVHV